MPRDRISLPSSGAGITRYFDDYKSKIEFKPHHIIVLAVLVIIIEIFLHIQGKSLLGLG
jgi:preprotein translocase subunit Sec61beta